MSASTQTSTASRHAESPRVQRVQMDARREVAATMATLRSTASEAGSRMPELIEGVRAGALDGARTVETWPEPTRRLVAAFSIGLGAGLTIAGAPRVLIGGALLPALAVAATAMRGETARPN